MERRARELSETLKGMRNASDDELRKLRDDAVTYETTPWVSMAECVCTWVR